MTILVPDYDDAINHFCQDLGFELVEDTPQGGKRWVVVRPAADAETGIVLAQATTPAEHAAIGNQLGGRVGFFLHTDDFTRPRPHDRCRRALPRGTPTRAPGTIAVFDDKYGNGWDLLQPA